MSLKLSNNSMATGVSLFPVGTYKKAHRHGVGAHILILQGEGYSRLWFEGSPSRRVNWTEGTLISPQAMEFHQRFNTGASPAMYLKFRLGNLASRQLGEYGAGNSQIEYADEDPSIYEEYAEECARHGASVVLNHPRHPRAATDRTPPKDPAGAAR